LAKAIKKKEKTLAMQNKEKFYASGKTLPKCVNHGCDNDVNVRDWKNYSFRHECSNCKTRWKQNKEPREGVVFAKKEYCENRDGRLGFECPLKEDFKIPKSILHGDHIDGNHQNNTIENLQTLCSVCHHIKGMESGDFISAVKGRDLS